MNPATLINHYETAFVPATAGLGGKEDEVALMFSILDWPTDITVEEDSPCLDAAIILASDQQHASLQVTCPTHKGLATIEFPDLDLLQAKRLFGLHTVTLACLSEQGLEWEQAVHLLPAVSGGKIQEQEQ